MGGCREWAQKLALWLLRPDRGWFLSESKVTALHCHTRRKGATWQLPRAPADLQTEKRGQGSITCSLSSPSEVRGSPIPTSRAVSGGSVGRLSGKGLEGSRPPPPPAHVSDPGTGLTGQYILEKGRRRSAGRLRDDGSDASVRRRWNGHRTEKTDV